MDGGLALLVRGIRWRRGTSLVLVLCASVTVAGAAAGPTWGRVSQASLLERVLQEAPVSGLAFTVQASTRPDPDASRAYAPDSLDFSDVGRQADLPAGLDELFDQPTEVVSTARRLQVEPVLPAGPEPGPDGAPAPPPEASLGRLVARDGACAQVRLVQGRCPESVQEVLLSDRSAAELGVSAGEQVRLPELAAEPAPPGGSDPFPVDYLVSGTYAAAAVDRTGRFWFDSEDFEYAPATVLGGEAVPARLDAVLVLPDLVLSLWTPGLRVQVERVVQDGAITLSNADRVLHDLEERVAYVEQTRGQLQAEAPLAVTVRGTETDRRLVAATSTFVGLQVVVLGWFVLFGLVAVTVAARSEELALAKLRGLRGARLAAHALAEPLGLLAVAVPLGVLLAQAAVRLLAASVLLPGTAVGMPVASWVAVGATVLVSAVACAMAARSSLRVPVADQLRRRSGEAAAGTASATVTAVLGTLVTVAVVLVLTQGRSAQAALPALLTPVLIGLVAGLLVAHAVRVLVRVGLGRTVTWPLAPYLAVRQVAGQGALTRTTALITAATAVSGFAAGAWVLTAEQRAAQAALDVGAERVVHVGPTTTTDLLDATHEVDPDGGWAMAAVQRGTGQEALLAVDSSRFAVATPVPGGALAGPGGLDDDLVPEGLVEPLVLTGPELTVRVAGVRIVRPDVELALTVRVLTADDEPAAVRMGVLDGGAQTLTAPAPACVGGCTVLSLVLPQATGSGSVAGEVDLVSIAAGGRETPFLLKEWRVARVDESRIDSAATGSLEALQEVLGLRLLAVVPVSATTGVVRRDVPTELPALLGAQTTLQPVGLERLLDGSTLEGGDLPFREVGRTPALPRTEQGAVVDLELVSRVEPPRSAGLDFQVWLGATAPDDAPGRLAAAGLDVLEVETRVGRRDQLDRAEPARAQLLLLGAGAATLVAGTAGVATALAAAARRRAAEAAALRAMAVPGRTVRAAALLEGLLLLLPGVLVGALCARAAVSLCAPVLAEVTGASPVVAGGVPNGVAGPPVLAVAAGTVLLLALVVWVLTRHGDDETRLRQGM